MRARILRWLTSELIIFQRSCSLRINTRLLACHAFDISSYYGSSTVGTVGSKKDRLTD